MPRKLSETSAARHEQLRQDLGPFAKTAETTRMAMLFTDGRAPDNPIVFANYAFLQLTGFAPATILGARLMDIFSSDNGSGRLDVLQEAIAEGDYGIWELPCRMAGDSEFAARIFLSPLRDEDESVRYNLCMLVDLPANQVDVAPQPQPLPTLAENAPGFIASTMGPEHRFTFANASYESFVGRKNLVGLTVEESLPELVDQGIINVLDEVYRTGDAFLATSMPLKILNADSDALETRSIDCVYQPMRDAKGAIAGIFCEGYDVTEKNEANAALIALQSKMIYVARINAMGTMAATLAHEINQPLSAIGNYLGGVCLDEDAPQDEDRMRTALQGIEEAYRRASEILQHLREFTRRRKPTGAAFDLGLALDECVRLVRASTSPDMRFDIQIPDEMTIRADRIKIQQVLINLLLNACEATAGSDPRVVTITAYKDETDVRVCVADTGRGIPRDSAEEIFSWAYSSKIDGMGLGLSISRTIIGMHGGRIWLEEGDAEGAEFCFTIPQP